MKAGAMTAAMALGAGAGLSSGRRFTTARDAETRAGSWDEAEMGIGAQTWGAGPRVFQAEFPFTAVGVSWSASVGFPVIVSMRFSGDGVSYGDPVRVSAATVDAGRPDRDGRFYSDLAFAPSPQWVEYQATDVGGDPVEVEGLTFNYIDSMSGPTDPGFLANSLDATTARPSIISRAAWGANENYRFGGGREVWPPEYAPVEHVIIHHTDTPNNQDPYVALRSIYYYHAVTRGWGDIGYNYLVDGRGNIFEGRYGGENVVGGHAFQYAEGSSGIGVIGQFAFRDVSAEAQAGIVAITAYAARNLDPYARKTFWQVPNLPTIAGHRDVTQTSCPGDYLYRDLATIRDYVSALQGGIGPAFGVGSSVQVSVAGGNLRSNASIGASILAAMNLGTVLTITATPVWANGYQWYPVTGPYGNGWAAQIILAATSQPGGPTPITVGGTVEVATDALNLRSSASLSGGVIAVLFTREQGTVLDGPRQADGYTWYQLQTNRGTGWAAGDFLRPSTTAAPAPTPGQLSVGDAVVVNTDALNMRSGPGTNQSVVAVLSFGTPLTVIDGPIQASGYVWWAVRSAERGSGWCASDFIAKGGPGAQPEPAPGTGAEFAVGEQVVVTTDAVNLRSGPSIVRSVLAVVPNGVRMEITSPPQRADGYTWYGVFAAGYGGGWCVSDFLGRPGGSPSTLPTQPAQLVTGQRVRVFDGSLNFRAGPGTGFAIINVVPDGSIFTVTGSGVTADGYTWYPVRNPGYGDGWCVGAYLEPI